MRCARSFPAYPFSKNLTERPEPEKTPGIVSLLKRAGTISGDMKARDSVRHLALYVDPKMPEVRLRDRKSFDRAVEIGHEDACATNRTPAI